MEIPLVDGMDPDELKLYHKIEKGKVRLSIRRYWKLPER